MAEEKFYPVLADLINPDIIPDSFGIVRSQLSALLGKIFYDNFQSYNSVYNNSGDYNFDIIVNRQLKFLEIPGTGISIIINPDDQNLGAQESRFAVNFSYNWEVFRFVNSFNLTSFDFSFESFYNVIADSYGINAKDILLNAINSFVDVENRLDEFVIH